MKGNSQVNVFDIDENYKDELDNPNYKEKEFIECWKCEKKIGPGEIYHDGKDHEICEDCITLITEQIIVNPNDKNLNFLAAATNKINKEKFCEI